ncbi:sigma-70 family RNA polymerase sigma factor [Undibacterium amnicola]|uniref:Sigma-70 family RNA polymerase sigma factor n=1 Tax=Undibacterium amnicola TaxID=1834038 RepID=A0ABR6XS93_9BURK|nr:ECF-type sigma factor [Undibacterium amnicola]MBC3832340.1 sigma-70 family RNA polymerase sigma factor [Undibacterium amnicola]
MTEPENIDPLHLMSPHRDIDLPCTADVTQWLTQAGVPEELATSILFTNLYKELLRLARGRLRHEAADQTLSATALTHEAYCRLSAQHNTHWKNRSHFMAMAATMMRRILIDAALAKQADKRAAEMLTLSAAELVPSSQADVLDVLDVHRVLNDFEQQDPRAARIVELRYFGGLELEEIAEAMELSLATVKRDWTLAKTWLKSRL